MASKKRLSSSNNLSACALFLDVDIYREWVIKSTLAQAPRGNQRLLRVRGRTSLEEARVHHGGLKSPFSIFCHSPKRSGVSFPMHKKTVSTLEAGGEAAEASRSYCTIPDAS